MIFMRERKADWKYCCICLFHFYITFLYLRCPFLPTLYFVYDFYMQLNMGTFSKHVITFCTLYTAYTHVAEPMLSRVV